MFTVLYKPLLLGGSLGKQERENQNQFKAGGMLVLLRETNDPSGLRGERRKITPIWLLTYGVRSFCIPLEIALNAACQSAPRVRLVQLAEKNSFLFFQTEARGRKVLSVRVRG